MASRDEDHTYKMVKIVGSSGEGVDAAIRNGVRRADRTLQGLRWLEVKEIRGWIDEGEVQHFQAVMEVGFRIHDDQRL